MTSSGYVVLRRWNRGILADGGLGLIGHQRQLERGAGAASLIISRQLRTWDGRRHRSEPNFVVQRSQIGSIRHSSTAPSTGDGKADQVSIRDAVKSPSNMLKYVRQSAIGLWHFLVHFWNGSKLLAADVRVSFRILKKISSGKAVSRRERNLLVATGADLARLLPFSFFILVPFMEFALPFALRFFPNMLPSQFQDELKREEDAKKQLKVRLEVAKYFQDVVSQRAKTVRDSNAQEGVRQEAEELAQFLDGIRTGKPVEEREVFRFARFFNDEVTIDGAVRPQLVAMCKYLGLSTYGADAILRFRIRSKLNAIKNDDMQIMWEGGVDSLTDDEVQKACQERGIRTIGVSKRNQKRQLGDWLEMSQDREDIPENALKETLSSLPHDVLTDIKIATDTELTSAERLEELKRQERLIAAEEAQSGTTESSDRKPAAEKTDAAEPEVEVAADVSAEGEKVDLGARVETLKGAVNAGQRALDEHVVPETLDVNGASDKVDETDQKALFRLAEVLETLESDNPVEKERLELEELKAELLNLEARITDDGEKSDSQVGRLKSGIARLEREFERTQQKVGLKMKILDADKDGVIHIDEVLRAVNLIAGDKSEEVIKQVLDRLDENQDGVFRREDIKRVRREIKQELGDAAEQ